MVQKLFSFIIYREVPSHYSSIVPKYFLFSWIKVQLNLVLDKYSKKKKKKEAQLSQTIFFGTHRNLLHIFTSQFAHLLYEISIQFSLLSM